MSFDPPVTSKLDALALVTAEADSVTPPLTLKVVWLMSVSAGRLTVAPLALSVPPL